MDFKNKWFSNKATSKFSPLPKDDVWSWKSEMVIFLALQTYGHNFLTFSPKFWEQF